ncbi:MAG TPA: ferredoxin [bacterium]|uniref:Ferredoxin n=1 Tax=candidate division TA06 bacterium ADurb.Bin417 TaxID=1852828 RepID=A0A1V5MKD1_UNCT6|nr:MAG: Ferredoxin [candidate division TA06 bacterium ADurb.Bin417]HNS48590.1 ferredoxin [bacterium]
MKVKIDADVCTGCGLCADNCPDVFVLENDLAKVKVDPVPASAEECARQAVQDCPVSAISEE